MVQTLALGNPQTTGEEIANSLSHGIGLLAAMAAVPVLVLAAIQRGDAPGIVGASVFGTTMVLMYLTSTLYHTWPKSRAKRVFQVLDHGGDFPPDRWNVHAVPRWVCSAVHGAGRCSGSSGDWPFSVWY